MNETKLIEPQVTFLLPSSGGVQLNIVHPTPEEQLAISEFVAEWVARQIASQIIAELSNTPNGDIIAAGGQYDGT